MAASLCASLFQGLASFAVLFLRADVPAGAARPVADQRLAAAAARLPDLRRRQPLRGPPGRQVRRGAARHRRARRSRSSRCVLYAQLSNATPLWWIVCIGAISAVGACLFFPANSSAIMKAAPPDMFGIASGMLRTFSNIGMVFSFSVAILVASRSISRQLAFAIFVGTTSLHGQAASAFTTGLHAAFYESVGLHGDRRGPVRAPRRAEAAVPDTCYSQPFLMLSAASSAGARAELAGADLVQHHAGHAHDGGRHLLEAARVGRVGDVLRHLRPVEDARQVGELARQPAERVLGQLARGTREGRVPVRGELRVVVRAVEAAGLAVDRLEQVDPPDGLAHRDRDRRVDGALQLAPVEDPQLEPDTVLRPLLSGVRVGVEEVDVADDDADLLEDEGLEHANHPLTRPGRPRSRRRLSHYHPASDRRLPVTATY